MDAITSWITVLSLPICKYAIRRLIKAKIEPPMLMIISEKLNPKFKYATVASRATIESTVLLTVDLA